MTIGTEIVLGKSISSLPDLDANITQAYGVLVDGYTSDTNPNLKEIGILADCDEDDKDNLSLDVIDCILAYSTFGSSVILEVPYSLDLEPSSLVIMAGTTRFDLSILPPESLKKELSDLNVKDADGYVDRIISFCEPWFKNPASVTSIHPFTGYFSYLVGRELGHKPASITSDNYMQYRFVDTFSVSAMDYVKEKLTTYIFEMMGGEQEFRKYAHTLAATVYKQVEDIADEIKRKSE